MPAFHETLFPPSIALGASGGPRRATEIVALGSGREARNARWAGSRRRFDVATGVKSLDDLAAVVAFFEARRGRLHGFRFRDPLDHRSGPPSAAPTPLDQPIGTGDGATRVFALVKRYGDGETAFVRPIVKPVAGSVRIAVAGVEVATDVTVDPTSGLVTFAPGHAPAPGAAVTAGFLFDTPVRFDTDEIRVDLDHFAAGRVPAIPLLEVIP